MKLSEYKKDYHEYSGKASDVVRTAAFSGIAVVWVFRDTAAGTPRLPEALVAPTLLFVVGIFLDVLQYVLSSLIWGVFYRVKEKSRKGAVKDLELSHPYWFTYPGWTCFVLKILCVLAGYVCLGVYLLNVWR